MADASTIAMGNLATHLPVRQIRVRVVTGPDAGALVDAQGDALAIGTATDNDLCLTDPTVSGYHVELTSRDDGIGVVDHGSTNGTWLAGARVERATVPPGTQLAIGSTIVLVETPARSVIELFPKPVFGDLVGHSNAMRRVMSQANRVAASGVAVLVNGESGTGKELVARAIHEASDRADGPLVTVDCGTLHPNLVASELFGHERGAFTGADKRHLGAFERANGGTVFLDEVGELPADLQTHLLGVLERRRFRRVGGSEDIETDVRVICATNRDLRARVNQEAFRLDLYYRIAVVTLTLPPLRERPEDIPPLIRHFAEECGATDVDELFSPPELARLCHHDWPGNVRELRNVVEATVAMGEPVQLPVPENKGPTPPRPRGRGIEVDLSRPYKDARGAVLDAFESRYLKHLLKEADGNVSQAARNAKMTRSHLFELLRKHGIR